MGTTLDVVVTYVPERYPLSSLELLSDIFMVSEPNFPPLLRSSSVGLPLTNNEDKSLKVNMNYNYDNFILRGSGLRQTEYIIGVAVYIGHNTKSMRNNPLAKQKISKLIQKRKKLIIIILLLSIKINLNSSC